MEARTITIRNSPLTRPSRAGTLSPTLEMSFTERPPAVPSVGIRVRQNQPAELSGERRRAGTVTDELHLFGLRIDVLKIAVVDALLAELGEQVDGESGIEVVQHGSGMTILE